MAVGGNNYEQISENSPGGATFGATTTSNISFYGVAPAAQISAGTLATTAPTSTSPYGFTSAQATAILAACQALKTLGLVG
jgi:hypothetical protein